MNILRSIRQHLCNHAFYLDDLTPRGPDGLVTCPCCGCGKVLKADCGLNLPGVWLGYRPKRLFTAQEKSMSDERTSKVINDLLSERRELRELLTQALALMSEPAGMTEEIIRDKAKFSAMMKRINERDHEWKSRARQLLAPDGQVLIASASTVSGELPK